MGCFSWLCKECDKGIKSTSFSGDECLLFLLKDGEVVQKMEGQYNSYGSCFVEGYSILEKAEDSESQNWEDPTPQIPMREKRMEGEGHWDLVWERVCELMHGYDLRSGIAAYHKGCYLGLLPTTRSESDPNQGWGEDEDEGE